MLCILSSVRWHTVVCLLLLFVNRCQYKTVTAMENLYQDNTPGCYMNATLELLAQRISLDEFLDRCLAHFGPTERRVHHSSDDCSLDGSVYPLLSRGGKFGLMAAAIKACETDPLASSLTGEHFQLNTYILYKVDMANSERLLLAIKVRLWRLILKHLRLVMLV